MRELKDFLMQSEGASMYVVFLLLLLLFFVTVPIKEFLSTKKEPADTPVSEKEKCKGYIQGTFFWLWGAVFVVLIMCFIGRISLAKIGFRPMNFNYGFWFTTVILILAGLFFAYLLYGLISLLTSTKARKDQTKHMPDSVKKFLPQTRKEKWLFSFVAFSAGVCEEVLYRGFLTFLIWAIFPVIPVYLIILITSILFGIGHLYQGIKGVFFTAVLGAFFICLYLVTDSLFLPMLLHFLNDFVATFLFKEEDVEQTINITE